MPRLCSPSFVGFALALGIAGLTGCSTGTTSVMSDGSAEASATASAVHRSHQFYYYPEAQVYRDCEANRWYWMESGQWQFGATLPQSIVLDAKAPFAVELKADDPT